MWFVTRRRYEEELAAAKAELAAAKAELAAAKAELAAAKAEAGRQRERAQAAEEELTTAVFNRKQLLRQLDEARAQKRTAREQHRMLTRRVDALIVGFARHANPQPGDAARLQRRVDRLRRIVSRLLEERRQEQHRADRLQRRLDDAVGLTPRQIVDSSVWQPGYQKPTPKGAAS